MRISKLCLKPGDKVRYKKDGFIENDPTLGVSLTATKGSLGTVVAYEEYRQAYERRYHKPAPREHISLGEVYYHGQIQTEISYPLRLDKILPTSHSWDYVPYKEGDIVVEGIDSLEKLHDLNPEMILILDRVRVSLPEEAAFLRPPSGYRLLVLEFTIENGRSQPLPARLIPRAWLVPAGNHGDGAAIEATPTLRGSARIAGQVIFEIPEPIHEYTFRLELPEVGSVEMEMVVQDLKIGDTVRLKGKAYAHQYDYFLSARPYDDYPPIDPFFIPDSRHISKDSYGVLVPFAKFRAAYVRRLERWGHGVVTANRAAIEMACAQVKMDMEEGIAYPVELKDVVSPAGDPSVDDWTRNRYCREGEIVVIDALALKKGRFAQKPMFAIEWVRVVLPGDAHPLRPQPGNKLLLIDFIFDHPDPSLFLPAKPPRLSLACNPPDNEPGKARVVQPLSLELPDPETLRESGFASRVTFEVPQGTYKYDLSLEAASAGRWNKTIVMPGLQPGDQVRLIRDYYGEFRKSPTITIGSLGRVVSFAEYCADYQRRGKQFDQHERVAAEQWSEIEKPLHARDKTEARLACPVRLEKILPSSDESADRPFKEGDIHWFSAYFWERVE